MRKSEVRGRRLLAVVSIASIMSAVQVAAQQPRRIGRILLVDPCPSSKVFNPTSDTLTKVLAELGWRQEQNLTIDCVSARGRFDDLGKIAAELVARQPELLVTQSSPAIRAVIATNTNIPLVMSTPDPVGEGFVQSLARPGGTITGVADLSLDLAVKRIELLKELLPQWTKISVLYRVGGDATYFERLSTQLNRAVDKYGINWRVYQHQSRPDDLEPQFRAMQQDGYDVLYLVATTFTLEHRRLIGELALRYGIRLLAEHPQFARDGALLSYGVDANEVQRPMAERIDAILRGAKPDTLPVEQMTKLNLLINLKTARALGVQIPPAILARADELVE